MGQKGGGGGGRGRFDDDEECLRKKQPGSGRQDNESLEKEEQGLSYSYKR